MIAVSPIEEETVACVVVYDNERWGTLGEGNRDLVV